MRSIGPKNPLTTRTPGFCRNAYGRIRRPRYRTTSSRSVRAPIASSKPTGCPATRPQIKESRGRMSSAAAANSKLRESVPITPRSLAIQLEVEGAHAVESAARPIVSVSVAFDRLGAFQCSQASPQVLQLVPSRRHVAQESSDADDAATVVTKEKDPKLDREPPAAPVECRYLEALVAVLRSPTGHRSVVSRPVTPPELLRNDDVQGLARCFRGGVAEGSHCSFVPEPNHAFAVGHHDCVGALFNERTVKRCARLQGRCAILGAHVRPHAATVRSLLTLRRCISVRPRCEIISSRAVEHGRQALPLTTPTRVGQAVSVGELCRPTCNHRVFVERPARRRSARHANHTQARSDTGSSSDPSTPRGPSPRCVERLRRRLSPQADGPVAYRQYGRERSRCIRPAPAGGRPSSNGPARSRRRGRSRRSSRAGPCAPRGK